MVPPAGRTNMGMVGDDGLEPPTFCVYDRRSDQAEPVADVKSSWVAARRRTGRPGHRRAPAKWG